MEHDKTHSRNDALPSNSTKQLLNVYKNSLSGNPPANSLMSDKNSNEKNTSAAFPPLGSRQGSEPEKSDLRQTLNIPSHIVDWLARLTLLYGVPFDYLVADAAMLPPESIRFFYLDQNWTNRMIDGAVNIALGSTQDYIHILTSFEQTSRQAILAQQSVRSHLHHHSAKTQTHSSNHPDTPNTPFISGFLLSSTVVSNWPGLEVTAYADKEGAKPLTLLRMDRLSDNVLICLFNGIPQLLNISEPPEGMHFGVITKSEPEPEYRIPLRGVGTHYPAGQQLTMENGEALSVAMAFRPPKTEPDHHNRVNPYPGVLDIDKITSTLITQLSAVGELPIKTGKPVFTSSHFALQMVRGAGLQQFIKS